MTIQIPNVGTGVPADQTGDSPWLAMKKVADNFSNATHAASKLVGGNIGNVPVMTAAGFNGTGLGGLFNSTALGDSINSDTTLTEDLTLHPTGVYRIRSFKDGLQSSSTKVWTNSPLFFYRAGDTYTTLQASHLGFGVRLVSYSNGNKAAPKIYNVYTDLNTTKDSNGFIKAASPIVKVHADKIVLNEDAKQQDITFTKNGIGDYTINTVTGLSTDGWYLELPKDLNGNPKVAVTLSEVDGVISLKSYKRIFSMETFTFEPDLDSPIDVPDERWIDIRLNEIEVDTTDIDLDKED